MNKSMISTVILAFVTVILKYSIQYKDIKEHYWWLIRLQSKQSLLFVWRASELLYGWIIVFKYSNKMHEELLENYDNEW